MKKIQFIPTTDVSKKIMSPPQRSSIFIPDWYKNMNKFLEGDNSAGISKTYNVAPNTTLKSCSPFMDGLLTGYIWSLPCDVEIRKEDNFISLRWRVDADIATEHSLEQHPGLPPAYQGKDFVMKWTNHFIIKTPPGYSTFFTHPINRHDLVFRTFSGVVDTDTYDIPINFPFQMLDFEEEIKIIEKGTPLCQFFPFKRESWKSEVKEISDEEIKKSFYNLHSTIVRSYKKNFWHKKFFN